MLWLCCLLWQKLREKSSPVPSHAPMCTLLLQAPQRGHCCVLSSHEPHLQSCYLVGYIYLQSCHNVCGLDFKAQGEHQAHVQHNIRYKAQAEKETGEFWNDPTFHRALHYSHIYIYTRNRNALFSRPFYRLRGSHNPKRPFNNPQHPTTLLRERRLFCCLPYRHGQTRHNQFCKRLCIDLTVNRRFSFPCSLRILEDWVSLSDKIGAISRRRNQVRRRERLHWDIQNIPYLPNINTLSRIFTRKISQLHLHVQLHLLQR